MRAVFINYCHPDMPHVCAVRLRSFAEVLARRGHRIVLLTATLSKHDAGQAPAALAGALAAHDWSRPFRLAARAVPAPLTEALQDHRLPPVVSQAVVLWCYLVKGGVFWNWAAASRAYWPTLAGEFAPDMVWATFGNTDSLHIARGLAAAADCPWVMDIKDLWGNFIPPPLRTFSARRSRSAAVITTIFGGHSKDAARWFDQPSSVIYSGFPKRWLDQELAAGSQNEFRIMLTGSIYDGSDFRILMDVLEQWLRRLAPADARRVTLAYAGGDRDRVEETLAPLVATCTIEINGFLPLEELRRLQVGAGLNIYVQSQTGPYRQKFMELLTVRRPILCFPGEAEESIAIAETVGGELHSCDTPSDIAASLDTVWRRRHGAPVAIDRAALGRYSWESQADRLLRVFSDLREIAKGAG